jgi:Flp pilus assembly protein TadD
MKFGRLAWLALTVAVLGTAPVYADPTEDDPDANALDPDFAAGKSAIDRQEWNVAIASFSKARLRDPQNADIETYLGYAYRKRGEFNVAFQHYRKALALNPRHRGAHEYIGETYLLVGNLAKAEEHLSALKTICVLPCEELGDLEVKIAEYRKGKRVN